MAINYADSMTEDASQDSYAEENGEDLREGEDSEVKPVESDLLQRYIESDNIAKLLDADTRNKIGRECLDGYTIDKGSRGEWEKRTKAAMDLATQVMGDRAGPWANSADVKYPLITTGAVQFHARAYPAIVGGSHLVMGTVNGPDPKGKKQAIADKIGLHMSHQLLNVMSEWEEDTDKLLLMIAIVGCAFRKVYFDKTLNRNVSEFISADDVVYNHRVPWGKLRRISHELKLWGNDVLERIRTGLFLDVELGLPDESSDEEDGYYEFIEQHCWYDLDEDGYREPYIVTIRKDTGEVARIVARYTAEGVHLNERNEVYRIEPVEYWVKYPFIPNPDGGSYDIGLGYLLMPINETVNTILNQMLDAGTLQNLGGGVIGKGVRAKGGSMKIKPGEYMQIDASGGSVRDSIVPFNFPGPSMALFQLLGMLVDSAKGILSVTDVMSGETPAANTPATTTLAMIEQGMKVFSAIYKRIHRAFKHELGLLYRLNKEYGNPEEYYKVDGESGYVTAEDYAIGADIVPVSDPNLVSDAQKLAMAEALMQFRGDTFVDQKEIRKRYLSALKEPDLDKLLLEKPVTPPPDPNLLKAQASILEAQGKMQIAQEEAIANIEKMAAETANTMADSLLKLSQTKSQELMNQMQAHTSLIEQFMSMAPLLQQFMGTVNGATANGINLTPQPESPDTAPDAVPGATGGMEAIADDSGNLPIPDGQQAAPDGAMGESELLPLEPEPSTVE